MAIVYQATNRVNGKRYIGVTIKSRNIRRGQHLYVSYKAEQATCRIFHAAIRKYGPEAFMWETLDVYKTKSAALDAEKRFIAELNPEYNISKGGQGNNGVKWTEIRKIEFGNRMRGRVMSPAARQKWHASYAECGYQNPIICLDDGKEFRTAAEAGRYYKCSSNAISAASNGKARSVKGRHFAKNNQLWSEERRLAEISRIEEERTDVKKAVERTPEWNAKIGEALKGRQTSPETIAKLRGQKRSPEVVEKFRERANTPESLERWAQYSNLGPAALSREVICLDHDAKFPSASAAADFYGLSKSLVIEVCNRHPRRVAARGMIFRYVGDYADATAELTLAEERRRKFRKDSSERSRKTVVCLNDGKVYARTADAAAFYGIHPSEVAAVANGARRVTHGYVFAYQTE